MRRNLRITVDHDTCVGNANRTRRVPGVFRLNDEMQSEIVDPAGADAQPILTAAEVCPVSAITVVDSDTGETLFPAPAGAQKA